MTEAHEFPVVFDDPADALQTWERDDMHLPSALTPLAEDFVRDCIGGGFNPRYAAAGVPYRLETAIWNGWAYFSFRTNVPADDEEATEASWTEANRASIPTTAAAWRDSMLPELRSIFDGIAATPVDDLGRADLARAWSAAWSSAQRSWVIHFFSIMGPYQVLEDLADAYAAVMGAGHDVEALSLAGGSHHELEDVDASVEALAALAGNADLRAAVEAAAAGDLSAPLDLDALRATVGGDAFVDALETVLAEHGHLGQNHDDLRNASWADAPRLLLGAIALRLQHPPLPAAEREAAQRQRADELEAEVRHALRESPEDLAGFEALLAHAREIGWLTEGHNYWIDRMSQARLRTLSMRVGRRLVREGQLDEVDDIFFLHRGEVAAAIEDGLGRQALVAERRAQHARNERLTAPYYVGKVPDEPSSGDRFDGPRLAGGAGDVLSGKGASPGVVRGPARVTLSQDDFGRIKPGDIVVCPSSNPSWVPVFTIAGGLVTNTGGVLSHAAVVAREFGLPAVVGTGDATTRIADGRLIEIDGTAGSVRLL